MKLFFIVCLSCYCLHSFPSEKLFDRTLITVNSEAILESDVLKFQQKLKSKSFQELFGGLNSNISQNREALLQLMVEEKLIDQHVKKLELTASEQEIEGNIRAILKRNEITQAQLNARLKQLGSNLTEYKEGIRRQIERKNLIDREIRPSLEISEEQLKHYYARSAKSEDNESQFKIAHILVGLRAKGPAAWDDAKNKAQKIYQELSNKPDQFESSVKEYSDDDTTHDSGGSLGYFSASSLAKEFRSVVLNTPVGTLSTPIKMVDGYHILKVQEVKAGDFNILSKEKKEQLRQQIVAEEVEKKMALWLDRKKREANIHRMDIKNENK